VVRDQTFSSAGLIPWNANQLNHGGHGGATSIPIQTTADCLPCLGLTDAESDTTSSLGGTPISTQICGVTWNGILTIWDDYTTELFGMLMVIDMIKDHQDLRLGCGEKFGLNQVPAA
jgi:hypothetical protein